MAMTNKYKYSVVVCARWESPYIVEWLNYYREIGYDHVFLYCNDDKPDELYEKVLPFIRNNSPFVSFRHYVRQGEQLQMYADFIQRDRNKSEWISFFDVDEYLRLPVGENIGSFLESFPSDVDCVLFNWVFFGPNGHKDVPGKSILREYTRRQASIHPFTKYIIRSECLDGKKLADPVEGHGYWHSPLGKVDRRVNAVNVLGEDMSNYYDGFPVSSSEFVNQPSRRDRILAKSVVHHYAFRTEAAFSERVRRGLGGAFGGQELWGRIASQEDFGQFVAGLNAVEDDSLANFWSGIVANAYDILAGAVEHSKIISRMKPAFQSSVSAWSRHVDPVADASGATNGVIDGRHKFHTDLEDGPWWCVDLELPVGVSEVRVYNRTDQPGVADRASRMAIDFGFDPDRLSEVYRREVDEPFGGVDGKPLVFKPSFPIPARYVRIRLLTRNYLHLDQVEVYGEPLPEALRAAFGAAA